MDDKRDFLEQTINQHLGRMLAKREEMDKNGIKHVPVITISTEPGSYGDVIAEELARQMKFEFYNREIIQEVAKSTHADTTLIKSAEQEQLSGIQDLIASLVRKDYIWPGLYLEHLIKVTKAISKKGQAVFVGRGICFILPPEKRFAVLIVAPQEKRIEKIAKQLDKPLKEVEKLIKRREKSRSDFVKKSFHADVNDPVNYDITINTKDLSIEAAVDGIKGLYYKKFPAEQK